MGEKCCEKEGQCCSGGDRCEKDSDCGCSTGCDMTDTVLKIANDAWASLMKEKMKAHLEKARGKQMDKVAEAAVEASLAYWSGKMENRAKMDAAIGKLRQTFSG